MLFLVEMKPVIADQDYDRVVAVRVFLQRIQHAAHLHIGMAIDPLSAHERGNQRYLAIPWLDTCLTACLPVQPGQPLKTCPRRALGSLRYSMSRLYPLRRLSARTTRAPGYPTRPLPKNGCST